MAITPATLRLDLKCGKGSISPGEKCHKGKATEVEEPTKAPRRIKASTVVKAVGLGALAVSVGASLVQIRNMRLAYDEKFGGTNRFEAFNEEFGDPKTIFQNFRSAKGKEAAPSMFSNVRIGHVDGKHVVIKQIGKSPLEETFGPGQATMMQSQGVIGEQAAQNIRFAQKHLTRNEVDNARIAGELGFGPKVVAANKNTLVADLADGRPLITQNFAARAVRRDPLVGVKPKKLIGVLQRAKSRGLDLDTVNKQRVLASLAKMHTAGIAHNDLHLNNIFISKKGAQFIDYGLSERGGTAVAAEFVRMMNPPRAGLQQAAGMGFNLKSLDPRGFAQTERAIKQAIGKRLGSVTSTDIRRAAEKNPALDGQLQSIIDAYYAGLTSSKKRHDAFGTMTLTPALLRLDAGIKCGAGYIARGKKCHNGASPEDALRGPRNYQHEIEQHKATMEANNLNAYIENRKLKRPKTGDDAAWDKLNLEWRNSPEAQEYSAAWKRIEKAKADRKNRNAGIALGVGVAAGLTAVALSGRGGGGGKSFKMPGTGPRPRPPASGPDLTIHPVRIGVGGPQRGYQSRLPAGKPRGILAGTATPQPPALPGLTPKGLLKAGAPRLGRTQRLRANAQAAARIAEQRIARAAQAEITRAGAVANGMAAAGEAAGMASKNAFRGVRLRAEAARRKYEPGYRSPDKPRAQRALPQGPDRTFQVPFRPQQRQPAEGVPLERPRGKRRIRRADAVQFYGPRVIDPARR
jgi:hypothetical protein